MSGNGVYCIGKWTFFSWLGLTTIVFLLFTTLHFRRRMLWSGTNTIKNQSPILRKETLSPFTSKESKSHRGCFSNENDRNISIIFLQKPFRRFHGNHWFHVSEYYLSKLHRFKEQSSDLSYRHVKLIVHEPTIYRMLTPISFYWIAIAIYSVGASSVEIFPSTPLISSFLQTAERQTSLQLRFEDSPTNPIFGLYQTSASFKPASSSQHQTSVRHSGSNGNVLCGRYEGSVGAYPIRTSEWFFNHYQTESIRQSHSIVCRRSSYSYSEHMITSHRRDNSSNIDSMKRRYKLVIFQRDQTRLFSDLDRLILSLQKIDSGNDAKWDISVIHHNELMDPCDLYQSLKDADIYLTAHGFQSTALMMLKKGAAMIEIFPYKYYRETYFPLCAQFGIHHRWIQNDEPDPSSPFAKILLPHVSQMQCMRDLQCRSFARSRNIAMPTSHIALVQDTMRRIESGMWTDQ